MKYHVNLPLTSPKDFGGVGTRQVGVCVHVCKGQTHSHKRVAALSSCESCSEGPGRLRAAASRIGVQESLPSLHQGS